MMRKINCLVIFLTLFTVTAAYAQQTVEMADTMRANGKIYVVVGIIIIILLGLILYLLLLDRKVKKLENILHDKHHQTK